MAAPNYTEDLTDITLAESTTGWSALGGGASGLAIGADFAMQGTNCVDKQITAAEKGQVYNNGAAITPGAAVHFFVWAFLATPGVADTLQNRGLTIAIGTSTTAYNKFHVEGSDTYGAVGRVGKCYPIRYVTTGNASPPYRTLVGSPGANPQYFGALANILASVKSSNLGVDAIRYGTGIYITAGDAGTPGTFSGAAAENDAIANRWGILTYLGGSSYELQGRFVVGQNNAGTATAAYFVDSNKSILLVDTPHSLTDFTQIIFDHASTFASLSNITIEAAGTHNPGKIVVQSGSTDVELTACTFSKIGTTDLHGATSAIGCTWRGAGQITLQSATLDACAIVNSTAAVALKCGTSVSSISNIDFVSSGTGHALEITGGTTHTLNGITFTGYAAANGSTGNEAVYVNVASGDVTIYADSTFSYRTAGATVTIIAGAVTTTVLVTNEAGSPISGAAVALYAKDDTGDLPYQESVTITNSGTTATVSHTGHGLLTNDKMLIKGASHWQNNGVFPITVTGVDSYTHALPSAPGSNPTGTITATWAAIYGDTDVNGEISMSRVFSIDQPVAGWARKSTSAPYYKTGPVSGTIDSALGANLSALLLSDE